MDVTSLYRACAEVAGVLRTSGLQAAVKSYRRYLVDKKGLLSAQTQLTLACSSYMKLAQGYDENARQVTKLLHLQELESEEFWTKITAGSDRATQQKLVVSAYSKIMFAGNHLPRQLQLLRSVGNESTVDSESLNSEQLQLRLFDRDEVASKPRRIARAIAAFDLIYSASAAISGRAADDLEMLSISGHSSRSLSFRGDARPMDTARHVIQSLIDAAEKPAGDANTERLVASLPTLIALEQLGQMSQRSPESIARIRKTLTEGCLMMLEAKVQLTDRMSAQSPVIPVAGPANSEFDNADLLIEKLLREHSYEQVLIEKQRLANHADRDSERLFQDMAVQAQAAQAQAQEISDIENLLSDAAVGLDTIEGYAGDAEGYNDERIDELILDLDQQNYRRN